MVYYESRYSALKHYPNAIVRKIIKGNHAGQYTVFNSHIVYIDWLTSGYIKK